MKKLSKKQKIIGFIAILLVAVIIAIIIATNIIKNNNQVASYIKKGITIGGVTGKLESLNTFDATATAEDIAYGKTAYVKGEKIVGTRIDEDMELNLQEIYYADLDSSGEITVDGIIFADVAGKEESGEWRNSEVMLVGEHI